MPTAVISGRVDEQTKLRADAVIRNAGETVASVISSVWHAIAETGELPASMGRNADAKARQEAFASFVSWADALPEPSTAYAGMSDDEILALKVDEYV